MKKEEIIVTVQGTEEVILMIAMIVILTILHLRINIRN